MVNTLYFVLDGPHLNTVPETISHEPKKCQYNPIQYGLETITWNFPSLLTISQGRTRCVLIWQVVVSARLVREPART